MTSQALMCYALGLLAYAMSKVVTSAFYALRDTWTSVRLAFGAIVLSIPLSLMLMWPLHLNGLALAATITNSLNAYWLIRRMEQRLGAPILKPIGAPFARMGAASLLMGFGCWAVWQVGGFHARPWLGLPIAIGSAAVVYLFACRCFHVQELATATRWLKKIVLAQPFAGE